jgi:uncharacterized protein with ParB-like and HNH nuclease domain
MQAQDMPFSKLINAEQGAREHFHVPKYQREYTWGKTEWEQMLTDIEDNDAGYFMGSIICVNDTESFVSGDEIVSEVVDGQQRLTTLSLLLMVIYSKLSTALQEFAPSDDEDKQDAKICLDQLRAKLIKRKRDARAGENGSFTVGKNTYFLRVQPSGQNHNLTDYRYLLCQTGLLDNQPKQPNCGNRILARAYYYFEEKIPSDVPSLLKWMTKINQLMFVQITVGNQADAFTLFESLNNRGVPLSAIDIIKNKMLAQMERKHAVDIDESFDRWQKLIEAIPDTNDQERFLRHFYNTFKHLETIKVDKVTRATRSHVIRIYETLINRDAKLLFDELTRSADIYGKLINCESKSKELSAGLTELAWINSTPAYLILLYLSSLEAKHFADGKFLVKVVELLARYFIRRNVTDIPPTRQIDQAFIDVVETCAARIKKGKVLDYDWFVAELLKHARPATLKEFKTALGGQIYDNNTWMARYVLIQLDQMHHSREYKPDFWARDEKGKFVWTVEHVLPQAEKLPDHWVKMIANGDRDKASALQDEWVHRLGNLTLSGYNSDLATASLEKKQKLAKDKNVLGHKINIGYQNGLVLNSLQIKSKQGKFCLADAPQWNTEMISARTDLMVDMIAKANLLPGE